MRVLKILLLLLPLYMYGDKGDVYLRSGKVYNDVNYAYLVESRQMRVKFNECPERTIIISVDTVLKTENHSYEVRNCVAECKQKGKDYHWKGNKCIEEKPEEPVKEESNTFKFDMEFVLVPAGEFRMGCSEGDSECDSDEKPAHTVKISKPFYMGKYEVTQGQWKAVMGENPSWFQGDRCPTEGGCDNHPVENVSWDDVQKFIEKLNARKEGFETHPYKYRLPTEAEREYAARGGSKTKYYWGDELGSNNANCDGCGSKWDNKSTSPVGSFKPNAFGLYDMSGNVWEWCEDMYDSGYYQKSSQIIDPVNREGGDDRVIRGGSWNLSTWYIRVSSRYNDSRNVRFNFYGFRLLRTAR